jgi:hypothetical protein
MVKVSRHQAKAIFLGSLSLAALLLLYLLYLAFSLLADLLTLPGALAATVLLVLLVLRVAIEILIFPGSLKLWKRSIESHFCQEMATQILLRVKDLQVALEILLDSSSEKDKSEFLPRSIDAATHAKRMISTIIHAFYELQEQALITKHQKALLDLMFELQTALVDTKIIVNGAETCTMWDWMDSTTDEKDWVNVIFEDFPNNSNAHYSLSVCHRLEEHLLRSCGQTSLIGRARRWLFDTTLGNIDQMRVEMVTRFHAEQIWVSTPDGTKLDCMWVPCDNARPESPTMLLCNPNAGFYEFAYYQSEWLEYYIRAGVNVMLWNYRGYGRTKGRPTPDRLKKDGVVVAEYLKSNRKVGVLGVHGESLGGMVATHIARTCGVDFLFADRTFCSLNSVSNYNFGRLAQYLYTYLTWWHTDSAQDFLYADCYKVISADPNDTMINDLASLKSGVAVKLLETQGMEQVAGFVPARLKLDKYYHILSPEETSRFLDALVNVIKVVVFFNKTEGDRSPRSPGMVAQGLSQLSGQSNYQLLGRETDSAADDESLLATIYRLYGVLDELDAGGKPLTSVYAGKDTKKALSRAKLVLQMWLIVLDVWGSFDGNSTDLQTSRSKSLHKVRTTVEDLQSIYRENEHVTNPLLIQLFLQVQTIIQSLTKVNHYLEERVQTGKSGSLASTLPERSVCKVITEYAKAGYLIPLSCGHSGPFNAPEKLLYEAHLERVRFFK